MSHLVVVPTYNCATQVERTLAQFEALPACGIDRILVVDNRSHDATLACACRAAAALPIETLVAQNPVNYGLGGSQKVGFAHALENGFERVTVLHGDDQASISDLTPLLELPLAARRDALLGARFMRGSRLHGYSAFRTFGNHVYNRLFSLVAGERLQDLGSGLNSYSVRIFRDGFHLRFPDDLTFNYCMVLAHARFAHDVSFFPIQWREVDQVSNVRLASQAVRVLRLLGAFASDPDRFLAAEHRTLAQASYPTKVVYGNQ